MTPAEYKAICEATGLTQKEIAKRLDRTPQHISRRWNGKDITVEAARAIRDLKREVDEGKDTNWFE